MTTTSLTGFVVRETEKAVAFVVRGASAPLWLPRKKISSLIELDELGAAVQLKGERIQRQGVPVKVEVDAEFLAKVVGVSA